MKMRTLLLATALMTVAGMATAADEKGSVMVKPSWNTMKDGAPPPLAKSDSELEAAGVSAGEARRLAVEQNDPAEVERRASRSKTDIMKEQSDEQVEWMRNHNKEVYGTDEGPFTELEKQEQMAIEAKKRVSVYGMTYAEREAMLKAEAEAAAKNGMKPAAAPAQDTKKSTGYIYNRKKTGDAPPRLFNNVTP